MRDNELFKLLRDTLLAGFSRYGLTEVGIKQAYQPTPVGPDYEKTIYLSKINEVRYGWVVREDNYNTATNEIDHTETQIVESVIQVNGWVITKVDDFSGSTGADITNNAAEILNSDLGIQQLLEGGASILRITNIRIPYFLDDRDRFAASPSFDLTIVHSNTRGSITPPINTINSGIYGI